MSAFKIIKLDFLTMKQYYKTYLFVLAYPLFLFPFFRSFVYVLSFSLVVTASTASSIFSVAEKNQLGRLYSSLAITKNSMISGRYAFIFLHAPVFILAISLLGAAVNAVIGRAFDYRELVLGIGLSLVLFSYAAGFQIPLVFRLGYTKSRYLIVLPFILLGVSMVFINRYGPNIDMASDADGIAEVFQRIYDNNIWMLLLHGKPKDFSSTPIRQYGLAMDSADLAFCREYFAAWGRNPTLTELRVIDTYWSDHCRHTTFLTELKSVHFEDGFYKAPIQETYERYINDRDIIYKGRDDKFISLMDIALMAMRKLRADGKLDDMEVSDEINACSIIVPIDVKYKDKKEPIKEELSIKN